MDHRMTFATEALPQLPALRDFALSLCRDEQRAADLVQDTMMKAYRKFDTYAPGTNCRAWLFQICKHCFINDRRRDKLAPLAVDLEAEGTPHDEGSPDLREIHAVASTMQEQDMGHSLFSDEVMCALRGLPSDYQTVLILSDIEGWSYEEIAGLTRSPLGTVRSRIHRARKLMAMQLAEYARREGFVRNAA